MPEQARVSRMSPCSTWPYQSLVPAPRIRRLRLSAAAASTCCLNCSIACTVIPSSEARQIRERQHATGDPHLAEFGAAVQGWNRLVRIEQEGHVERALDRKESIELG